MLAALSSARADVARTTIDGEDHVDLLTARRKFRNALKDYYSTPAGQAYLTHTITQSSGNERRVSKLLLLKEQCSNLRATQIAMLKTKGVIFSEESVPSRCENCGQFTTGDGSHDCPGRYINIENSSVTNSDDSTRQDVHRPSSIDFDPEKYMAVAFADMNPDYPALSDDNVAIRKIAEELRQKGYRIGSGNSTTCGHCGTHIRYVALLQRDDVKEYIYVGEQCLNNRFDDLSRQEFERLRTTSRLNRERRARKEQINTMVEWHPALAWLTYPEEIESWASEFVLDVGTRFRKHGLLSDRQVEAVERAIAKDSEYYQRRRWEREHSDPVPTGVTNITGTVVSTREERNPFADGTIKKILVRDESGWKVWMTCPVSISEAKQGDKVSMVVNIEASGTDNTFGFGSRPRRAQFIEDEN